MEEGAQNEAVELLQELGLKEYQAKSFVALTRLRDGTAKDISQVSTVPRTRVYDALRALEAKGLVEIQHTNPQQFRAVPIDEAVETLKTQYLSRSESLRAALEGLEPSTAGAETEVTHEVWSLSGTSSIVSRAAQLIDEADEELVVVFGHEAVLTLDLIDRIRAADDRGVHVIIGTISEGLREQLLDEFPRIQVFVSGLEWLGASALEDDTTGISRLVMVDQETILVSSFTGTAGDGLEHEQAVFGRGFKNGLVTIVRRLMKTGLIIGEAPVP